MGRDSRRVSTVSFVMPLTCWLVLTLHAPDLSAAVDVYSDWVDACDAVAKDAANRHDEHSARGLRRETAAIIDENGNDNNDN